MKNLQHVLDKSVHSLINMGKAQIWGHQCINHTCAYFDFFLYPPCFNKPSISIMMGFNCCQIIYLTTHYSMFIQKVQTNFQAIISTNVFEAAQKILTKQNSAIFLYYFEYIIFSLLLWKCNFKHVAQVKFWDKMS